MFKDCRNGMNLLLHVMLKPLNPNIGFGLHDDSKQLLS